MEILVTNIKSYRVTDPCLLQPNCVRCTKWCNVGQWCKAGLGEGTVIMASRDVPHTHRLIRLPLSTGHRIHCYIRTITPYLLPQASPGTHFYWPAHTVRWTRNRQAVHSLSLSGLVLRAADWKRRTLKSPHNGATTFPTLTTDIKTRNIIENVQNQKALKMGELEGASEGFWVLFYSRMLPVPSWHGKSWRFQPYPARPMSK